MPEPHAGPRGREPVRAAGRAARRWAALLAAVALLAAGCLGSVPADAQGTLERATGGVLRVGVSQNPPHTLVGPEGQVTGNEVDLLTGYAATIDAEIDWTPGAESVLAEAMGAGELDVVVGGLTSDSPWTSDIAMTRPYGEARLPGGATEKLVMGVRPGENALQVDLELYLAQQAGEL